ncbi:MAG TPA: hypothetical protein VH590_20020 [Ktedonobacterales bacterium]
MVSSGPVPWYNLPPREFPAQKWLKRRYPFSVSPSVFARHAATPAATWRPFPALLWLAQRERLGG